MNFGVWILIPLPIPVQYSTCSRCGSHVPLTFNYCSFCGNLLHPERVGTYASKICGNCQKRVSMMARFCPECGYKQ